MNVPDAAIEAAAEALRRSRRTYADMAGAALEAAMPAIREAIAQEVEAINVEWTEHPATSAGRGVTYTLSPLHVQAKAARIVRGGTP